MKKSSSIMIIFCIIFSLLATPTLAVRQTVDIRITYRNIAITLNDDAIIPADGNGNAVEPFIYNGTTYLPIRGVANSLGLNVKWDSVTNTVTLTSGGEVLLANEAKYSSQTVVKRATYRDIVIILDGTEVSPVDAAGNSVEPFIVDGTTYLPVRAVSEALNLDVVWDSATSTVQLYTKEKLYDVVRVVDGDTIVINYNGVEEKVRMIGIDTPESVHPDSENNTEGGVTAAEYTRSMLEGQKVSLEFDVQERDMYGRLLAYVYLDGVMFNKTLLEKGYAVISTYPPNVKYVDEFTAIVDSMKGEEPETGDQTGTYTGSTESDKYHYPTCRHSLKILEENLIWFDTEEEALAAGYSPCGTCKP